MEISGNNTPTLQYSINIGLRGESISDRTLHIPLRSR